MPNWIERVRTWVGVAFNEPVERIERAMVRVFLVASALLSALGLFDLIRLRTPESGIQFVAAGLLTLLTLWMDRSGRAYPRSILALAATAGLVSVVGAALDEDYLRLTDASPTVIIALTGVLAFVLGGRWAKHVAWFWVCLLVAVVSVARWPVTNSIAQVFTDVVTTLIVSALAFTAVVAIRNATQQSRADYERLMETAPVGAANRHATRIPLVAGLSGAKVPRDEAGKTKLCTPKATADGPVRRVRVGAAGIGHRRGSGGGRGG